MVKEVCTDTNQTQTQFANSMSDRGMEALQILNTLCTLPLEKMNTFLLTCLYLSFTLYTHFLYFPLPTPSLGHPPQKNWHFTIIIIIAFSFTSSTFAIRQHDLCCSKYMIFVRDYTYIYTLCLGKQRVPRRQCIVLNKHVDKHKQTSDPSKDRKVRWSVLKISKAIFGI